MKYPMIGKIDKRWSFSSTSVCDLGLFRWVFDFFQIGKAKIVAYFGKVGAIFAFSSWEKEKSQMNGHRSHTEVVPRCAK